jgi:hypothetical protein
VSEEPAVRAGDAGGAVERLAQAVRYGATASSAAKYGELTAFKSRADYPNELR